MKAYSFVGGSHDGNTLKFPSKFKRGFHMAIRMRTFRLYDDRKEVYKLERDGKFHFQNAIMQGGVQVAPERPGR